MSPHHHDHYDDVFQHDVDALTERLDDDDNPPAWHDHYQRPVCHNHDGSTHQHHTDGSIDFYDRANITAVHHVARPDDDTSR